MQGKSQDFSVLKTLKAFPTDKQAYIAVLLERQHMM